MNYTDLKFDELQFEGKKEITKYFEDANSMTRKENIFLSCMVTKINDAGRRQKRKFILTNYAIYNFETKSLQK